MNTRLYIASTRDTPEFYAENGEVRVIGQSMPANAFDTWQPLVDWISDYCTTQPEAAPLTITLELWYENTATQKIVRELLHYLNIQHANTQRAIGITWVYDRDSEDTREEGEELFDDALFSTTLLAIDGHTPLPSVITEQVKESL